MPSGHSNTSSSPGGSRRSGNSTSSHGYDYGYSTTSRSFHYSDRDSHQTRQLRELSRLEEFLITRTAESAGTREHDARDSIRQYEERMERARHGNNNDDDNNHHYTGAAGDHDDGRQRAYRRDDREFRYYEQYGEYDPESSSSRDAVNGSGATGVGSSNSRSGTHRSSHRSSHHSSHHSGEYSSRGSRSSRHH